VAPARIEDNRDRFDVVAPVLFLEGGAICEHLAKEVQRRQPRTVDRCNRALGGNE
jgi:hypothetical protein